MNCLNCLQEDEGRTNTSVASDIQCQAMVNFDISVAREVIIVVSEAFEVDYCLVIVQFFEGDNFPIETLFARKIYGLILVMSMEMTIAIRRHLNSVVLSLEELFSL